MKKIIFFSITLFILMCSEYANAQVPNPCNPDCFDTSFPLPPSYIEFDMYPADCELHVWYSARHACDTYWDVQIVKIETVGDDCWRYMPLDKLFKTAYNQLIKANPMNFPPFCPDPPASGTFCNEQWRISIASCWFTYQISVSGQSYTYTMPCINVDCCLQPMKICRICPENVITIDPLDDPWGGDCDEAQAPEPHEDSVCTGHCNWYLFEDEIIQPNDGNEKDGSMIMMNQKNVTVVKSNYIPITINSPKESSFIVRITDNYGKILIEQKGNCVIGANEVNISLRGLPSGNYIYTVIVDGNQLLTNKIILEK